MLVLKVVTAESRKDTYKMAYYQIHQNALKGLLQREETTTNVVK